MRTYDRKTLHGLARSAAALLLVLQATGGGAVALAHATDSAGGPAALESHHSAQCVVLHDAARCAQCQYAGARVLPSATRPVPPAGLSRRVAPVVGDTCTPRARARHIDAPPRAPPVDLF